MCNPSCCSTCTALFCVVLFVICRIHALYVAYTHLHIHKHTLSLLLCVSHTHVCATRGVTACVLLFKRCLLFDRSHAHTHTHTHAHIFLSYTHKHTHTQRNVCNPSCYSMCTADFDVVIFFLKTNTHSHTHIHTRIFTNTRTHSLSLSLSLFLSLSHVRLRMLQGGGFICNSVTQTEPHTEINV